MGAMKSLKMGKVLGTIRRKNTSNDASGASDSADPQGDGPEAIAARSVKAFCESGAPNNSGDEVLYLPPIVESAESSPQAAAECARLIRKYMKKDYWSNPTYQYNAMMLMRILADNPGPTFTRNIDQKFVDTVKELLRARRSQQVDQMLMETLTVFESTKAYDEGLVPLIEMWKKERDKAQKSQPRYPQQQQQPPPQMMQAQPFVANPHSQNYFARNHSSRKLPDPVELAGRLEEARTSAKLLQQVVTNTPPGEILDNDLIKEFADRCTSATRSIQNYMSAEDPAPDNDTMESMIDTNEQLQAALSLHQRAVLNAKKQLGVGTPVSEDSAPILAVPQPNGAGSSRRPSPAPAVPDSGEHYEPPSMPPPPRGNGKGKEREYDSLLAGPSGTNTPRASEDPFADPQPEAAQSGSASNKVAGGSGSRYQDDEQRFPYEPYHPGFNATPSYLGRQESALGKEAMHGAAGSRDEPVPEESDDIYNTTPQKNKGPMYRY